MKKVLLFIVAILTLSFMPNVFAADYGVRELVPKDIKTSIKSENLLYKNIEYSNGVIKIEFIKNNSMGDLKPTVSIALFDEERKCIGIIDYCENTTLPMKEKAENISINAADYSIQKGKSTKDVEYYGVIDENSNCRKNEYPEYFGLEIDEIGHVQENHVNDNTDPKYIIIMMSIVVFIIVAIFVYRLVFTTAYDNMDGEDTRKAYKKLTEENLKNREIIPETQPIAMPQSQSIEEKKKVEEENSDTDLTNMYR